MDLTVSVNTRALRECFMEDETACNAPCAVPIWHCLDPAENSSQYCYQTGVVEVFPAPHHNENVLPLLLFFFTGIEHFYSANISVLKC